MKQRVSCPVDLERKFWRICGSLEKRESRGVDRLQQGEYVERDVVKSESDDHDGNGSHCQTGFLARGSRIVDDEKSDERILDGEEEVLPIGREWELVAI